MIWVKIMTFCKLLIIHLRLIIPSVVQDHAAAGTVKDVLTCVDFINYINFKETSVTRCFQSFFPWIIRLNMLAGT